jgi:hypothetical protein
MGGRLLFGWEPHQSDETRLSTVTPLFFVLVHVNDEGDAEPSACFVLTTLVCSQRISVWGA